ncbi:MAG: FAD binding domain-containing protein [Jatrophihabitantaceae bacterium]
MIPAPFEYVRVHNVEEVLVMLAEHGEDAKVLAGGHSLLPMMKLRLARPEVLVDIAPIADLRYVRLDGEELAIGALSTHASLAVSELVRTEAPLLAHSASLVGDPQVRHRGTIGGSLAHADPAADLPMAVLAAGARMVLQGPDGRRTVDADDYFTGFFDTALEPGELLVEVRVPRLADVGWGYEKFVRRANDWAIVGVATVGGRIALANMGSRPLRAPAAEDALTGGASIDETAALAADGTEPVADLHADPDYRAHLARVLTARALRSAAA